MIYNRNILKLKNSYTQYVDTYSVIEKTMQIFSKYSAYYFKQKMLLIQRLCFISLSK